MMSWSRRLTVRTLGSHPNNRGSIPREITTIFRAILGLSGGKRITR